METRKFNIRRVDPSKPGIAELILRLQRKTLPHDTPVHPGEAYWWIAYDEAGDAAGYGALKNSVYWLETGFLARAGVLPWARGNGLQRRLIKVRERYARKLGWKFMLTDSTDNPPSSNNLIACGYKLYEPRFPWRASDKSLYWRKAL